jgi:hypothetical protein
MMKKLFESWRKFVDESKVVNLNRHAFNAASNELYEWFETIAYQDMSIDEEAPNYDELVKERAEHFKFAFLGAVESNGVELALEMVGIPVMYLGADMLGSLYAIMSEYDRRKALMQMES